MSIEPDNFNKDADNTIWISAVKDVFHPGECLASIDENGLWTIYSPGNSPLPEGGISALLVDSQNNKWIGTYSGSILQIGQEGSWAVFDTLIPEPIDSRIWDMVEDQSGNIYFTTQEDGLVEFIPATGNWNIYNEDNTPLALNAIGIEVDDENNKWLNRFNDLAKWDSEGNWSVISPPNGGITGIWGFHISNDRAWIGSFRYGTESYLAYFSLSDGAYTVVDTFIHEIWVLNEDADGNIWAGFGPDRRFPTPALGGKIMVSKISPDGNNITHYDYSTHLAPQTVVGILTIDDTEKVWIGTSYGLATLEETTTGASQLADAHYPVSAYPNPAVAESTIQFHLEETSRVSLHLYDAQGNLVKEMLDDERRPPGAYRFPVSLAGLPDGLFFCQLVANGKRQTGRILKMGSGE